MFGALFGIIAGIVMFPFLMLTAIMMGISPDSISLARGRSISQNSDNDYNTILGISVHLLTSAIAGIIFGFVTNKAKRIEDNRNQKWNWRRRSLVNNHIRDIVHSNNHKHGSAQPFENYRSS